MVGQGEQTWWLVVGEVAGCCRVVTQRGPGCPSLVPTSGDCTPFLITNVQWFPSAESAPAALSCGRLRMAGAYGFG